VAGGRSWVGELLQQTSASWALLRVPEDLSATTRGDVDVLVAPADAARVMEGLRAAGFVELPRGGASRGFLRYDRASAAWQWLDVHTGLGTRGGRVPGRVVAEILARRRTIDGLWGLDPGDELWTTLVEILLNGRPLLPRYRRRLTVLLSEAAEPSPLEAWLDRLAGEPGLAAEARALLGRQAWSALEARRRGSDHPARRAPRRVTDGLRALLQPSRRGVTLALLGPDGAGKTTMARLVGAGYPFPSESVYMGVGGPPGGPRRPVPSLMVRSALGLLVQWASYLKGLRYQLQGRLVIFDRYMEDPWLPQPAEPSRVRRGGRWLRRALTCPPPDVTVVLDMPGQVMYERKREHDPAWLEAQRQRYLRMASQRRDVVVIDNTQPQDAVCGQIQALLWERLRTRLSGASVHR
jgi:thymidylate kinase